MKAKNIVSKDPETIEDLKNVELWRAFNWHGQQLRCVPSNVNGGDTMVCRSCFFERLRTNRFESKCQGMCACFGHNRPDHTSVKFISADLNCILDERMREMARTADLHNRW